jgi:ribokinase
MKAMTIGGAMVDTIAIIDSSRIERMSMWNAETSFLLLAEGSKIEAMEVSTHCGGGAINAAVAMARLGADVGVVVKLGNDRRAEEILQRLKMEGVSTQRVLRDESAMTGASVIIASHDRNATIFTYRGANTHLARQDLIGEMFAVDLVHITGLSNASAECFPDIVECARAHKAFVSTNPGIRQLSSRGSVFLDHLGRVDLLVINRSEAEALVPELVSRFGESGPPLGPGAEQISSTLAHRGLAGGGYELSLRSFAAALMTIGLGQVAITDGRAGAFLIDGRAIRYCPALETAVAGTAGAGDAFSATLAYCLADQRKPEDALRAATLNAAAVVAHIDTQTGLLGRTELDAALTQAGSPASTQSWAM